MPPLWSGFLPDDPPAAAIPEHLQGKRILITGAGGFLGSALARALAPAAQLILVDQAEHGLYRLGRALGSGPAYLVGSVAHPGFLRSAFAAHAPQIVFHAAAHKHVPLMEANPLAAAETNILGTEAVLAAAHPAEHLVLLSTDKAVAPVGAMGATKLVAERLMLAAGRSAVRLPNVLGSSGSVAPLFTGQIWKGGPVTVTHPDATRFFVSPKAAVRSLLAATAPGLWIPQTGPARRIRELAEHMIARSGRAGVGVVYTGQRPGARRYATVSGPGAQVTPGDGPLLRIHAATAVPALDVIREAVRSWDGDKLRQALGEYRPA